MHTLKIAAASVVFFIGQSLPAQAKDNWEFHEDQWNYVVVHEKRTISDDSLSQWGAWVDIAPTAAGGGGNFGPAIGFAPPRVTQVYRPVAEVTAPTPAPVRAREPRPCPPRKCK